MPGSWRSQPGHRIAPSAARIAPSWIGFIACNNSRATPGSAAASWRARPGCTLGTCSGCFASAAAPAGWRTSPAAAEPRACTASSNARSAWPATKRWSIRLKPPWGRSVALGMTCCSFPTGLWGPTVDNLILSSILRSPRVSAGAHSDCAPALRVREETPIRGVSSSPTPLRRRRRGVDSRQDDLFRGHPFDPFKEAKPFWGTDSDVGQALHVACGEAAGLIAEIEGREWVVRRVQWNRVLVRLELTWGSEAKTAEYPYRPGLQQIRFWRSR